MMTEFMNPKRNYKFFLRYDQLCEFEIEYGFTELSFYISGDNLFIIKTDHRNGTEKELSFKLTNGSTDHAAILEDFMVELLSYSGNFYGAPVYESSPIFTKEMYDVMFDKGIARMEERKEKAIESSDANELIKYCRSVHLNPEPAGAVLSSWKANCPSGGQHYIMISTLSNEWGCGYCHRKGDLETLKQWVASRHAKN